MKSTDFNERFVNLKNDEIEGYVFDKEIVDDLAGLIERLQIMRQRNDYIVKDKVNFKPGKGAYLNISD